MGITDAHCEQLRERGLTAVRDGVKLRVTVPHSGRPIDPRAAHAVLREVLGDLPVRDVLEVSTVEGLVIVITPHT